MFRRLPDILAIEAILFGLIMFTSFFELDSLNIFFWTVFVIIPTVYIAFEVAKNMEEKKEEKERQQLFKDRQYYFLDIIEKYVPTLYKKKELAISRNDYKLLDTKWWDKEKKNFLLSIKNQYRNLHLSDEDYLYLIDFAVDNYNENYQNEYEYEYEDDIPTDPYEYEEYVANLLNRKEWTAKTTKGSGDHGVDVLSIVNRKLVAIQCKLYNSSVGNQAVQEVVTGMKYWEASIAVVVTNSNYTKHAIEIARVHNVYLLHHSDLPKLDVILRNPPIYLF